MNPVVDAPAVRAIVAELNQNQNQNRNRRDDDDEETAAAAAAAAATVTGAQVVLRWAVEKGWAVVPKTARAARLVENRRLFHFNLTATHVAAIDDLQPPPTPQQQQQQQQQERQQERQQNHQQRRHGGDDREL